MLLVLYAGCSSESKGSYQAKEKEHCSEKKGHMALFWMIVKKKEIHYKLREAKKW